MRKIFAMILSAVMLLCMFAGCSAQGGNETTQPADPTVVNLMDMYSVKDPEGLEYDQRTALYAPALEGNEDYQSGVRHTFAVLYGKDGKGVFMYDVVIFDSEATATAYKDAAGEGKVDGTVWVNETDATFFTAMESFIPNLQTWIDNMKASGMIEV